MQSVCNRIIVKIKKKFQDEIKTDSGVTFYKDVSFNQEENSTIEGEVVSVPLKVNMAFLSEDFKTNVKKGDTLYFNFNVVLDDDNRLMHDEEYWMVDYFNAIAVVRDGKTIPVGEYILLLPVIEEQKSDILFIPDMAKKKETNLGIVYSSNDNSIPEGSTVCFDEIGKFRNKINGVELFCALNSNIMYKL